MEANPSCTKLQSREGHGSSKICLEESSLYAVELWCMQVSFISTPRGNA